MLIRLMFLASDVSLQTLDGPMPRMHPQSFESSAEIRPFDRGHHRLFEGLKGFNSKGSVRVQMRRLAAGFLFEET
jgi:hypothetical protein